jgi:hypothetical protein
MDECADRLLGFFDMLTECDSRLAAWYGLGRSRKEALKKRIDVTSRAGILGILERGKHRGDIGRAVIEDLGFTFCLWNGAQEPCTADMSVSCGAYPPADVSVLNCVAIDLPEELGPLADSKCMAQVLAIMAEAWHPDWGGVFSRIAATARDFKITWPFVDWMAYASEQLVPIPPHLPPPAEVRTLPGLGILIIAREDPNAGTESERSAAAVQIEAALQVAASP